MTKEPRMPIVTIRGRSYLKIPPPSFTKTELKKFPSLKLTKPTYFPVTQKQVVLYRKILAARRVK